VTQEPARKRNRRGEGGKLRADILAAAAVLIEETGSEQSVTLREIARRVGIAAPSIYEHFPSRDAIVCAVIDNVSGQFHTAIQQALDSHPDPPGRLRAGCAAYLRFASQHPGQYRVLSARHEHLGGRPPGRAVTRAEAFNLLVTAVRDCAAAGQAATGDPRADAVTIWSALHGYAALRASLPAVGWPGHQAALDRILARHAPLPRPSEEASRHRLAAGGQAWPAGDRARRPSAEHSA
jgi:AcrR family transcriptional regulator